MHYYTKSIHTYMYSYIVLYTYSVENSRLVRIFDLILRARRTVNSHTNHAQCNPITINAGTFIVLEREHTVIKISHTEKACVTVLKFFFPPFQSSSLSLYAFLLDILVFFLLFYPILVTLDNTVKKNASKQEVTFTPNSKVNAFFNVLSLLHYFQNL